MKSPRCRGSQRFPTNYDGEFTRCPMCRRKLKLHRNGKVPQHNIYPSRRETKERIPGGGRIVG
jgi:hypothetical protein